MNLVNVFREHALSHPEATALLEPRGGQTRRTTFGEMELQSQHVAALLREAGLRPGDVVLVLLPMSATLYTALLALFRSGMVVMALDPAVGLDHIERCCLLQPPRGLIAGAKAHLLRLVSPAVRRISIKVVVGGPVPAATRWSDARRLPPHPEVAEVSDDSPALLTFTSGSTGEPKGAVRSHGFLLAQHGAMSRALALTPGDVDVATMPIVLLANLASRVTSLIPAVDLRRPGRINPATVVRAMVAHSATSGVASPAFFERLARYCNERGITLPAVRKLFTGGGPVFPRTLEWMKRMAPNAEVVALYGSTEAEPIARLSTREVDAADHASMLIGRGLLAGPPVADVLVRVLRPVWGAPVGPFTGTEFDTHCRRPNEPGEIVVSGRHVLKGYLNGQGESETKFKVGDQVWHRTGDAGYLDPRGRLWLLGRGVGRIDDIRGELYPFVVETAATADERVGRAAVVALKGKRVLIVEWRNPRRPADVPGLRCRLGWAQIDEVQVWDRLPVDGKHNAKIDYTALFRRLKKG